MKEVIDMLTGSTINYLSTVGLDNKPKVRPFGCFGMMDGKIWFSTGNHKQVFQEMQENPYVEISTTDKEMTWVRLTGKVIFVDDLDMKQRCLDKSAFVKTIYSNADNPVFEIFYLDEIDATFYDFSGAPPRKATL